MMCRSTWRWSVPGPTSGCTVQRVSIKLVQDDELMVSYDIVALYPSVPQDQAIELFHEKLMNDEHLKDKNKLTPEQIIKLFKTIVKCTYFMFDKKLYTQVDGLAIGAATSGFAANLFMERLEQRALSTFANPPSTWYRYVDDTFSKVKKDQIDPFLLHLNKQHPRIKFTTEMEKEGNIPFLDTLVQRKEDGTIKISIYRKPTHTDQYLDWRSNHHISQKTGIIRTFKHRIDTLVTDEADKINELEHVKKALKICGHPNWAMNKKSKPQAQNNDTISKISIPYVKGTSERISKVFRKYRIGTIHKPSASIKNLVCNKLKDKVHQMDKSNAIYKFKCEKCDKVYIGETERSLRYRAHEHAVISHSE